MSNYYPPLGFHFKVEFSEIQGEFQFQSVTGLSAELEIEEIAEGGENRFKHKLPVKTRYQKLVLKRGLVADSNLIQWCRDALESMNIRPKNLTVILLNEKHEPLLTWNIVHAYPVKWTVSELNAEQSNVVIETLELVYNYFNIR